MLLAILAIIITLAAPLVASAQSEAPAPTLSKGTLAPTLPSEDNSLFIESTPGDYVGQGQVFSFSGGNGSFFGVRYNGSEAVSLSLSAAGHRWNLAFGAASNAVLVPGLYRDATRAIQFSNRPGIDISSDGRGCNMITGDFEIKQCVIEGPLVTRFWARFGQTCDGPAGLTGEIRVNAVVSVAVRAPFRRAITRGSPLSFDVSATSAEGRPISLTAENAPPGAQFVDHGNGTGTFSWTPTADQIGAYVMSFRGQDDAGHVDLSTTLLQVTGVTSLEVHSEADEPIGRGADYFYGAADGLFRVDKDINFNTVRFLANSPGTSPYWSWSVSLAAPGNQLVVPGVYESAVGSPSAGHPVIQVFGNATGGGDLAGRFSVRQADYASDGTVKAFWATFEILAAGFTGTLRGELRFNAQVITDVTSPPADTTAPGQQTAFQVTATNAAGRHVALSAHGLPSGAGFVDRGDQAGTFTWTPGFSQIGKYQVVFVGDDGAGGIDSAATQIVVPGDISLLIQSDPEAQGTGPVRYTAADGRFRVTKSTENQVQVTFTKNGDSRNWAFRFRAPKNAPLQPAFYPGASQLLLSGGLAPAPTYPVFEDDTPHFISYCGYITDATFQVKQMDVDANGVVNALWATFERHCFGLAGALQGEIRYNARVDISVTAPLTATTAPHQPLALSVSATDRLGEAITLSVAGLPPGAAFQDHGDGTATLLWTPGDLDVGLRDLIFTAVDRSGQQDRAYTHVRVLGETRLTILSDPSDYVGGGAQVAVSPSDGQFHLTKNFREGASLDFRPPSGYGGWHVDLAGRQSSALAPGSYEPVKYYPNALLNEPLATLAVNRGYDACTTISGRFQVLDVTYGPGVEISSLHATFEQTCSGATGGLRGELRWNLLPATFAITATAGPHGTISPSGAVVVVSGGAQTFTITADATYGIADVLVDGTSVGAVGSYAFTQVTANHTIEASFVSLNHPPDASQALASPDQLWPPDHKLVPVQIAGVRDPDGDMVTLRITGVTQDEPVGSAAASDAGDKKCSDAVIAAEGGLSVRAERSGNGNGRVYVVSFTATDSHGAAREGKVAVCVPPSEGAKGSNHRGGSADGCVDDGQSFNSLGCSSQRAFLGAGATADQPSLTVELGHGPSRTLAFTLAEASDVRIALYDVAGRRVAQLFSGAQEKGAHRLGWNADHLRRGIYFCRLEAGRLVLTRPILVLD